MLLNEIFTKQYPGYWDPQQDNSQTRLVDLRRTRLTLAQLNTLRKMNDLRTAEYAAKMSRLQAQYNQPPPRKEKP